MSSRSSNRSSPPRVARRRGRGGTQENDDEEGSTRDPTQQLRAQEAANDNADNIQEDIERELFGDGNDEPEEEEEGENLFGEDMERCVFSVLFL